MNAETEIIKQLKSIDESINRFSTCFHADFDGITIHQTLEDIKVINSDIELNLKKIADVLEKQLFNQIEVNKRILKNLTTEDDAGQPV